MSEEEAARKGRNRIKTSSSAELNSKRFELNWKPLGNSFTYFFGIPISKYKHTHTHTLMYVWVCTRTPDTRTRGPAQVQKPERNIYSTWDRTILVAEFLIKCVYRFRRSTRSKKPRKIGLAEPRRLFSHITHIHRAECIGIICTFFFYYSHSDTRHVYIYIE